MYEDWREALDGALGAFRHVSYSCCWPHGFRLRAAVSLLRFFGIAGRVYPLQSGPRCRILQRLMSLRMIRVEKWRATYALPNFKAWGLNATTSGCLENCQCLFPARTCARLDERTRDAWNSLVTRENATHDCGCRGSVARSGSEEGTKPARRRGESKNE